MQPIKSYTLKFYGIGTPVKGQMYKTYLRYYVTLEGKQSTYDYSTDYTLTKDQVKLLNSNELGGQMQNDLNKVKSSISQVIEGLNVQYNTYPTPDQLREFFKDVQHTQPMERYISDYLRGLKTKKSTKTLYAGRLRQWKKYYDLNLTKTPIQSLINKVTIEKYERYLRIQHQVKNNKEPLGDAYIHDLLSEAIRLLNMIADKQNLQPIPFFLKTPKLSEQYTPTDEEFKQLITVNCTDSVKLIQDLVYINSFIGIRIDELLNIKKNNVAYNSDHCSIHFTDFKNSKARDVIIIDKKAISLMKHHIAIAHEDMIFEISPEIFNRNLRKLATLALKNKSVYLYSTKKEKDIKHTISDVITSHCIRRYAIIKNIEKYGIDIARTFSGHSNYQTVVQHYAKDFMNKYAALKTMRKAQHLINN